MKKRTLVRKRTHKEIMSYPEMSFFMNESKSDVVFLIDGQRLPANKQLLIIKSRVFEAMFSGNFSESQESEKPIEIKDTTFDAFKTLIRFIYTEQMVLKDKYDFEHISDVYQLSDRYEILRLRKKIVNDFESKINVKDLISISKVVFKRNIEGLMAKVMAFIDKKINRVIEYDIKELKELNDATNNKLLNVLTGDRLESNPELKKCKIGGRVILVKQEVLQTKNFRDQNQNEFLSKLFLKKRLTNISFDAFKTFVGFLYFDKLILKDEEDLQLIREVCRLTEFHIPYYLPFDDSIVNHLKNKITVENLEPISGIAFDFKIDGLKKKVNAFTKRNFAKIVTKNKDILVKINVSTDNSLLEVLAEFAQKVIEK